MAALDLRYMKRIRFGLRYLGAWPDHVFEDPKPIKLAAIRRYGYSGLLLTMCSLGMVAQVMYMTKRTLKFIDLGQTCVTLLLSCVFNQRTLLPMRATYRAIIKEFALKFNLIHYKDMTKFSAKIFNKVTRICEMSTIILYLQINMTGIMFNIAPLYANYKAGMFSSDRPINGTFEHAVFYDLPFDQNNYICYTFICLYNWYVSYNLGFMFVCHDLMIYVFVFHIWGHLCICEHNLNHFPRPSIHKKYGVHLTLYTNEENKKVSVELKEIIKHYNMIREFITTTSKTHSETLGVYYGCHLVTDCVLLLECSTLDPEALGKYAFLTIIMFQQLIQLSVIFEFISSKGDEIIDAVYGLPWECMNTSNRRMMLMLLQIVQEPLSVKACGMVPVGVQTMVKILKTSFSYFVVLRTFADS